MKAIQFNGFGKEHSIDGKWITLYNKISKCKCIYDSWSYFDERPCISTNITTLILLISLILVPYSLWFLLSLVFIFIGWGELYLYLPIKTGKTDESDSPRYGFYFYCVDSPEWYLFEMIILRWGEIYKSIGMPWDLNWYRSSILLKNKQWEHKLSGSKKQFYNDDWKDKQLVFDYNYKDYYDNTIIPTKVYIEEREWRRRWLMWTSLFNKVNKTIDVHFSKEVGKKKGSWKGGVIGCSYTMKKDETGLECIKRMEQKRKF